MYTIRRRFTVWARSLCLKKSMVSMAQGIYVRVANASVACMVRTNPWPSVTVSLNASMAQGHYICVTSACHPWRKYFCDRRPTRKNAVGDSTQNPKGGGSFWVCFLFFFGCFFFGFLNPKPKTQNPKPKTQNPKPKTLNPKP